MMLGCLLVLALALGKFDCFLQRNNVLSLHRIAIIEIGRIHSNTQLNLSDKENSRSNVDMFGNSLKKGNEFARDDVVLTEEKKPEYDPKKIVEENLKVLEKSQREEEQLKYRQRLIEEFDDDNARPTGYGNVDYDEIEEEEERLSRNQLLNYANFTATTIQNIAGVNSEVERPDYSNDSFIVRFFKETYIGSSTDSRRRQQARYVVRNITFISLVIGIIFTATWYLFPGKFISYRADTDFTQRYTAEYVDPDDLLRQAREQNEFSSSSYPSSPSPYYDLAEADKATTLPTGSILPKLPSTKAGSVGSPINLNSDDYLDDGVGLPEPINIRVPINPNSGKIAIPGRDLDL